MTDDGRLAILLWRKIAVGYRTELLKEARDLIGKGGLIATVNPIMLTTAVNDPAFARVLDKCLCIPDGIGVKKALKKRGIDTDVYPGVELVPDLLFDGAVVGILGGEPGVAEAAFAYLKKKCGGINLAFAYDGFNYDIKKVREDLSEKKPHVFLVALGTPKQELLMYSLKAYSGSTLFIGVGGSLDVYSGKVRRAPRVFRKAGLEWLYRMLREPHRLKGVIKLLDFKTMESIERGEIL